MKALFFLVVLLGLIISSGSYAVSGSLNDPAGELAHNLDSLLLSQQFDKLESIANDFRQTDARFPGGHPKLITLYKTLAGCKCGNAQSVIPFEEKESMLQSWLTAHPQSLTAHIAMAELWISYAEDARGGGYVNTVSSVQWDLYKQRIGKAKSYLAGLAPKDDPHIYEEYTEIAMAEDSPRKELDSIYVASIHDFPRYFPFYANRAHLLQEKWFGQPGELMQYLQSLRYSPGGDDGQIAYAYAASNIARQFYREDVQSHTEVNWDWLKEGYAVIEKRYGFLESEWGNIFNLSDLYNDGELAAKAFPHILKSAEAGNFTDQFYVGRAYLAGAGVVKNVDESLKWFAQAANQGYPSAQYELGQIYFHNEPKNYAESLKWFLKSANQGDAAAQNNIGLIYELGGFGVTQDYQEAINWYKKALNAGNRRAAVHLGNLYFEGRGVPQDELTAYKLMQVASAQGDIEARQWLVQHPNAAQEAPKSDQSLTTASIIDQARDLMYSVPTDGSTFERAKRMIDEVLANDPKNCSALVELARYYVLSSYIREANVSNGKFIYTVGLHVKGYLENAETILHKALEISPNFSSAYVLLGGIYFDQSGQIIDQARGDQTYFIAPKLVQASEMLKKAEALGMAKDDPDLLLTWAKVLWASGDDDASAVKAAQVLKSTTRKSALRKARVFLGGYYIDKKQYAQVRDLYLPEFKEYPLDASIRMSYSTFAKMYLHNYDESVNYAREALSITNNTDTRRTLAAALYDKYADLVINQKVKKTEAQKYLEEARKLDPHPELQIFDRGSYAEESTFLKWMISEGYSVDTPVEGTTALLLASNTGRTDAVKILLSLGANPNFKDPNGWTPLLGAADEGNSEIVKMLIEKGADTRQTIQGQDAAMLAESHGNIQLASTIRDYAKNHQ